MGAGIPAVLQGGADAEIFPAVVERVAVDVVDDEAATGLELQDFFVHVVAMGSEMVCEPAKGGAHTGWFYAGVPGVGREPGVVLVVDDGDFIQFFGF